MMSDEQEAERERARQYTRYLSLALQLPDVTVEQATQAAAFALEQARRQGLADALAVLDEAIAELRGQTQPAVQLSLQRLAEPSPAPDIIEGAHNG
jgi:hypothetical protein